MAPSVGAISRASEPHDASICRSRIRRPARRFRPRPMVEVNAVHRVQQAGVAAVAHGVALGQSPPGVAAARSQRGSSSGTSVALRGDGSDGRQRLRASQSGVLPRVAAVAGSGRGGSVLAQVRQRTPGIAVKVLERAWRRPASRSSKQPRSTGGAASLQQPLDGSATVSTTCPACITTMPVAVLARPAPGRG